MEDVRRLVFTLLSVLACASSSLSETTLTCDLVQHKHRLRCVTIASLPEDSGLIVVHNVTMSHRESDVCVDGVRPTVTKSISSSPLLLKLIRSRCDGQYNCSVTIDNCHSSCRTRCVWMETSYSCEFGEIHSACQKQKAILHCGHQAIRVLMADYGRVSKKVCRYNYWQPPDTDCKHPVVKVVAQRCNGKHWCSVPVSNHLFPNKCPGTRKYLRYSYLCVDP